MFTGIVQERGRVASFAEGRLVVESSLAPAIGDSVSVDGVCLTVTGREDGRLQFDVMAETERRAKPFGAEVNLEGALRAGDPLGGHYVQGHVDGVGTVRSVEDPVWFDAEPAVLRYVVEKGSVCLAGVSLTVAALGDGWVEVSLIPETLERTNLGGAEPGRKINVECDVIAKYVERLVQPFAGEERT